MTQDLCARHVYAICGGSFKDKLEEHPGYNPAELCRVFRAEGDCIEDTAKKMSCDSLILKRFKLNSNSAADVVLSAICPPAPPKREMEEEK